CGPVSGNTLTVCLCHPFPAGPVAQWITRLTTDQKILGSTPGCLGGTFGPYAGKICTLCCGPLSFPWAVHLPPTSVGLDVVSRYWWSSFSPSNLAFVSSHMV